MVSVLFGHPASIKTRPSIVSNKYALTIPIFSSQRSRDIWKAFDIKVFYVRFNETPVACAGVLTWRSAVSSPVIFGNRSALLSAEVENRTMLIAAGLAILVVICLLLSMVQTPPEIGR